MENGGGGSSSGQVSASLHPRYWVWPLPDAGPIRLSCEWPLVGVTLSTIELDGAKPREAALRATPLWP